MPCKAMARKQVYFCWLHFITSPIYRTCSLNSWRCRVPWQCHSQQRLYWVFRVLSTLHPHAWLHISVLCTHLAAYHRHQWVFMTCWWVFFGLCINHHITHCHQRVLMSRWWSLHSPCSLTTNESPCDSVFFSGLSTVRATHYTNKQVSMMLLTPERTGSAKHISDETQWIQLDSLDKNGLLPVQGILPL